MITDACHMPLVRIRNTLGVILLQMVLLGLLEAKMRSKVLVLLLAMLINMRMLWSGDLNYLIKDGSPAVRKGTKWDRRSHASNRWCTIYLGSRRCCSTCARLSRRSLQRWLVRRAQVKVSNEANKVSNSL